MLHCEETGSGTPLVTVHGAWADGRHWNRLAAELSDGYRVITYDRRGHGRSCGEHDSTATDVEDLAGLLSELGEPAHVVGGSLGGAIALSAAASDPSPFLSLSVHEPALRSVLGGTAQRPDHIPTPRQFADTSLGDGAWERLTDEERQGFEDNGEVWATELADPYEPDLTQLDAFDRPLLMTIGGASPPFWRTVADAIPAARIEEVPGAGHLPHISHAREYAALLTRFLSAAAAPR